MVELIPLTSTGLRLEIMDSLSNGLLEPGPVSGFKVLGQCLNLSGLGDGVHDLLELGATHELEGSAQLGVLDVLTDQTADLSAGVQSDEFTNVSHELAHKWAHVGTVSLVSAVVVKIGPVVLMSMKWVWHTQDIFVGHRYGPGWAYEVRIGNLGTILGNRKGDGSEEAQGNDCLHFDSV